MPDSFGLRWW